MSSRQASHTSIRWAFDCSQWKLTSTVWFKCLKSIQPEERVRINRFVFQNDAISSMVGRLLMRKLAVESTSSHVTWREVQLGRSDRGKPYVKNRGDIVMNVSHHGRMTVLAAEVLHWGREEKELRAQREGNDGGNIVESVNELTGSCITNEDVDDQGKSGPMIETGDNPDRKHLLNKHVHLEKQANEDNQVTQLCETMNKDWTSGDQSSHVDNQMRSPGDQKLNNLTYGDSPGHTLQLGVDICKRDLPRNTPVREFFRIMRRNFHPAEWEYILAVEGEQSQLARFYRVWSLKESLVKAIGIGISVPLAEMCFLPVSEPGLGRCVYDTRVHVQEEERKEWLFEETLLEGGYCVAVALRGEGRGVSEPCEDRVGGAVENSEFRVDKTYEVVKFDDFEPLMQDVVEGDDEEIFYEAQDFINKQLRPWDS